MLDSADRADRIRRLLLAVPNRRRVFEAISHVPGTHLRRLSRELRLAIGSVEHHLRQLERHGLVFSHRAGRRRSYYVAGSLDAKDAALLHALRKPSWAPLLGRLLERGEAEPSQIAHDTGVSADTASYALRRMRAAGILEHVRVGCHSVYALIEPDRVRRLQSLARLQGPATISPSEDAIFGPLIRRAERYPVRSQRAIRGTAKGLPQSATSHLADA